MLHVPTAEMENKAELSRTRNVSAAGPIPYSDGALLTWPNPASAHLYPAVRPAFGQRRSQALATVQRARGNQAVLRMLANAAPRNGVLQRKCACGGGWAGGKCASCSMNREATVHQATAADGSIDAVPPIVQDVLRSPGQPLDPTTRASIESHFDYDFSDVHVHADTRAAESACAVDALAYTVGRDIVFGAGQYSPGTGEGSRLIAHELAHVIQNSHSAAIQPRAVSDPNDVSEREAERAAESVISPASAGSAATATNFATSSAVLQRTPARKVSCGANPPLTLPDGTVIPDPVGVITAAENQANLLLDNAIDELSFTIDQIRNQNAPIAFPTISDALALGLQIMGLDPNSDRVWKEDGGVGNYTAALLLRRLRLIRGTIGKGSFFFVCLGPQVGTIGACSGPICQGADSASCAGSFQIDFCPSYWTLSPALQAAIITHESSHNFAAFIGDTGRQGNAACYARFADIVSGSDVVGELPELCPDPT